MIIIVSACGQKETPPHSKPKRIIDTNDLTPVFSDDTALVTAIGRMHGCTVTHIGHGLAITAGHCFASRPYVEKKSHYKCGESPPVISWGVTYDDDDGYLNSTCSEILVSEYNRYRDYALIQVTPIPEGFLELAEQKVILHTEISIYSHPRSRPLEWSGWCEVEGPFARSLGGQFGYECDTEGGSSGAVVLNRDSQIVGIHNYYDRQEQLNGATYITSTPIASSLELMHFLK